MELLLAMLVATMIVRRGAVDVTAMATGRTPPSHAYRMAKLSKQQKQADPDGRGGMRRVMRHWYLDACEDVDEWRANRRLSRPERRARRAERKAKRQAVIDGAKAKTGELIRDRKARAHGDAGTPDAPSMPRPPEIPELPDNVLPFPGRESAGTDGTDGTGKEAHPDGSPNSTPSDNKPPATPATPTTGGDKPMSTGTTAPATGSDQAGLNPHVAALNASAEHLGNINTMLERIQAQMTQHGMGAEVTGALGTARDANTAAAESMRKAAEVTEQVNRRVQEAYNASRGQAANKEYQQGSQ